jgi:hypothetical protein
MEIKVSFIIPALNEEKRIANGRNTDTKHAAGQVFIFCDTFTVRKDPCNL